MAKLQLQDGKRYILANGRIVKVRKVGEWFDCQNLRWYADGRLARYGHKIATWQHDHCNIVREEPQKMRWIPCTEQEADSEDFVKCRHGRHWYREVTLEEAKRLFPGRKQQEPVKKNTLQGFSYNLEGPNGIILTVNMYPLKDGRVDLDIECSAQNFGMSVIM